MAWYIDLLVIVIALLAAPAMLARMLNWPAPPSIAVIWRVVAPVLVGVLGLLGYLLKRLIAYQWQPEPHERPQWLRSDEVSNVSVLSSGENGSDTRTDTGTDPVSVQYDTIARLQLDRSRRVIIDILVLAGWDVGAIRATLKGANDAIGIEVAEARQRLGIEVPERTVTVRDNGGPPREIPL